MKMLFAHTSMGIQLKDKMDKNSMRKVTYQASNQVWIASKERSGKPMCLLERLGILTCAEVLAST